MIQSPQMQQYIPPMPVTAQNQQIGTYSPQQAISPQPTPGYIYNYPVSNTYLPAQNSAQARFNGVNIEIINPQGQGNGYGNGMPQQNAYSPQPYYNNNASRYNGVNIEILNPQGQGSNNSPQQNLLPAQYYPVQQPNLNSYPVPPMNIPPMYIPPTVIQQQPVLPQQSVLPQPTVLQPIQPQQLVAPPVNQQIYTPSEQIPQQIIPPPQIVQQPQVTPQTDNVAPVIAQPSQTLSSVNPESFAGRLRTDNLDAQRETIEEIADKVKNSDIDAPILLDELIFNALADIIYKDTSGLQAPTPEVIELRQKNINELTPDEQAKIAPYPMEKANNNKLISMYTIAFMIKKLNSEMEKRNYEIPDLKYLYDKCGLEPIILTAKSNPDANLRGGAIAALSYIATPEYAQDLKTIFQLAQNDDDENVRSIAAEADAKLTSMINEENLHNYNNVNESNASAVA